MSYRCLFSILLAVVGLNLVESHASAADLDPGYAQIPLPQEEKVEFGSGWYVRGDLGVTRGQSATASDEPYYSNSVGPGTVAPSLSGAPSHTLRYDATLGGGYQFNKWFRADVTFDFHQPTISASQGASHNCVTGTYKNADGISETSQNSICTPTLKASLKGYSALVNGYVDLGTWYNVTPYVGAGVGMSFGHASASSTYIQNNNVPYAGISYVDALSGTNVVKNWDRSQGSQYYNLAFALMGGVSIDVSDHAKLDIGYRYLNLGQILGTNQYTHEIRAGLRYMLDNSL